MKTLVSKYNAGNGRLTALKPVMNSDTFTRGKMRSSGEQIFRKITVYFLKTLLNVLGNNNIIF